ncbi:MAG: metallophosphoesterase, partial [Burkholderia multivorans]|nr:metallophosphoesterase [Burkholderia multivorans]
MRKRRVAVRARANRSADTDDEGGALRRPGRTSEPRGYVYHPAYGAKRGDPARRASRKRYRHEDECSMRSFFVRFIAIGVMFHL